MISLARLAALRPYAYHTTTGINFSAIRHWRRLRSARDLLLGTPYEYLLADRRTKTQSVIIEGVRVQIRDQRPLQKGHIRFEPDFTFADLLAELNSRVFFWPGTANRPFESGVAHFRRYAAIGDAVVLRCSLNELLAFEGEERLYVATCNSGAPRSNPRTGPSVRGPSTYRRLADEESSVSAIKELSFRASVALPDSTEWAPSFKGPWVPVWPPA